MAVKSFRDLEVWQAGMDLVEAVYTLTEKLPAKESYILITQIRRSAISIPSNIAEGSGRNSTKELIQYLNIAYGSLCELETQILLVQRIYRFVSQDCDNILRDVASLGRRIKALQTSLRNRLS